jgi:hypothetical protein
MSDSILAQIPVNVFDNIPAGPGRPSPYGPPKVIFNVNIPTGAKSVELKKIKAIADFLVDWPSAQIVRCDVLCAIVGTASYAWVGMSHKPPATPTVALMIGFLSKVFLNANQISAGALSAKLEIPQMVDPELICPNMIGASPVISAFTSISGGSAVSLQIELACFGTKFINCEFTE